jgi:hypothetical protein
VSLRSLFMFVCVSVLSRLPHGVAIGSMDEQQKNSIFISLKEREQRE